MPPPDALLYFIISMNLLCGLVRARWAPVLYLVAVLGWVAWVLALPGGFVRRGEIEPPAHTPSPGPYG